MLLILIVSALAETFYLDKRQLPHKIQYVSHAIPAIEKRQSLYQKTIRTKAIELKVTCTHPFGEVRFENGICSMYADTLRVAAEILESRLVLKQTVKIETEFRPFCNDVDTNPLHLGQECKVADRTLGRAAPSAMYTFNRTMANRFGLDEEFGYPPSLARQYLPNDPGLPSADIFATFNSGINWHLASSNPPNWGPSVSINGGFLNQTKQASFDLVQIALHEYIHGFGFISSWTEYSDMFFPSYLTFDTWGGITGMMPPWIYTKYMSDRTNGVWFDSYRKIISASIQQVVRNTTDAQLFQQRYKQSVGHRVGIAVYNMFTVPKSVLIWYPDYKGKLTFGILNTPKSFSYGSSVSHLDIDTYANIGSFLMRPSATGGIELSKMIPNSRSLLGSAVMGIFQAMGYAVLLET